MDKSYAASLDLYEKLVATNPDVKRKGATMPYTSVNGHMFSFLTKEGKVALRLPVGARESFLAEYETQLVEQHGAIMKEYVEVPDALLGNTNKLQSYFAQSYAYVSALKPKPTKKKKS